MSRFVLLTLVCLAFFNKDALSSGLFGEGGEGGPLEGALEDKPILRALLMKQIIGNVGGGTGAPLPILRALMNGQTPPPIVRAMIAKRVMENTGEDGPLLLKLLVFRKVAGELGMQIIEGLRARKQSDRVYTFALTPLCDCALEYIDDEGAMKGFSIDLINAVCEEAGRNCETQYDHNSNCFAHDDNHFLLGEGLISKQYDVCMSWFKTKDRTHVAAFTEPYWKTDNIYNLYVPSDNPNEFDENNIAGKKIGFMDGWTGGHTCLEDVAGADTMTQEYIIQMKDLFNKLRNGELDAAFVLDGFAKNYLKNGFQKIGKGIKCAEPGITHAIARKDNDVTDWFSETLREMKTNGKYYGLCNKAKRDHGSKGPINCVVEGEEVIEFPKIKCGEGCWV
ncbi:putative histidine-binding protein [Saccoglossus kowalevskii]|uniref:Uncharacterized protein LOC100373505 n=1 Tax=Saccoglossus kowalevskii TaxID=10224 RepID=A0ABM0GLC1_SACKO|nr:PREDICTED: uncharacterized protein LOC100373505 [Saccoglossus kowalevskii]